MGGITDRVGDAPEEWYDPTTRPGLLAGLFQTGLYAVVLAGVFAVALVLDVVRPGTIPANPSTAAFWLGVLSAALVGAGSVLALHRSVRARRLAQSTRWRLGSRLGLVVVFWALLVAAPVVALFAGLAGVLARLATLLGLYLAG